MALSVKSVKAVEAPTRCRVSKVKRRRIRYKKLTRTTKLKRSEGRRIKIQAKMLKIKLRFAMHWMYLKN